MTDPFDALHLDPTPVDPPPRFAAALRDRLINELETPMTSETTTTTAGTRALGVTPYLNMRNAAAAIDFYVAAFGAVEMHRLVGDDGRVGHAQLLFGDSLVMLADEYPEFDVRGPESLGGSSCSFHLAVGDVDAAFARAISLGATEIRPVEDQFHGSRQGVVRDPFGHRWSLSTPIPNFDPADYRANSAATGFTIHEPEEGAKAAALEHQVKHHDTGDLYYFTLPARDLARAQRFFGALLGWEFSGPESGHVENISAPPGGLNDKGAEHPEVWLVVDDIHAAVARVRELGGTATEPVHYDSGWDATCTDDQGTPFHLSVPVAHYTR